MPFARQSALLRVDRLAGRAAVLGVLPRGGFQLFLPARGSTARFSMPDGSTVEGAILSTPHLGFAAPRVAASGPVVCVSLSRDEARRALGAGLARTANRFVPVERGIATAFAEAAFRHGPAELAARIEDAWAPASPTDAETLVALASRVPLARLAEELGTGVRQAQRHLLQATGLPPTAWRALARLWSARAALHRCPRASIAGIALDAGFHDQAHFTHAYRRFAGTTPARERRSTASDVVLLQDGGRRDPVSQGIVVAF